MSETRIDDVTELSQFLVALKSLGYRTTDQLIGAHQVAGDLLADYLKTDESSAARTYRKTSSPRKAARDCGRPS